MKRTQTRESIVLEDAEFSALEKLAARTKSLSTTRHTAGKPSWRVLIRRIARGEVKIAG